MNLPELFADLVMVIHTAFSLFVVLGLVFIVTGLLLGWSWINNARFRVAHLAATLIVVIRVWLGVPCPFSAAEDQLRSQTSASCVLGPDVHAAFHRLAFRGNNPGDFARSTTTIGLIVTAAFALNLRRGGQKAVLTETHRDDLNARPGFNGFNGKRDSAWRPGGPLPRRRRASQSKVPAP